MRRLLPLAIAAGVSRKVAARDLRTAAAAAALLAPW